MSKNSDAASHVIAKEIARLKYHYHIAANRKFQGAEPPGRVPAEGQESESQAFGCLANQEFENHAFVDRLRHRMTALGVTHEEIVQAECVCPAPPADEGKRLTRERTAILVIHGIGEQKPYETLDQFSRNLMRYLTFEGGISDLQISADCYDHNDDIEARIRLSTEKFGPQQHGLIDVYEYYWAPLTKEKNSYRQTLAWLMKTTFTPMFFFTENIQAMENPDGDGGVLGTCNIGDEPLTKAEIFRRELRRIALIYLPLVFIFGILAYLLPQAMNLPSAVRKIFSSWASDHPWPKAAMTFCFAGALLLYLTMAQEAWQYWLRRMRQHPPIVKGWWIFQTFLAGLLFLLAGVGIGWMKSISLPVYFSPLLQEEVAWFVLGAALAKLMQYFLKNFIGDVAVYTNVDAKAANYLVRKAILAGSTNALLRLLREDHVQEAGDKYDQVIVAGHSLGSVIAYDTLNQLLNKHISRADQLVGRFPAKTEVTQDQLKTIRGLVTFGSPLDKVHYFFRENVSPHHAVRAQLLHFLQSFRKHPSNSDYGLYRFQRYEAAGLEGVQWLNAWSKQDPCSGALHFYRGITCRHFKYKIPIYAHMSYWEDIRFYGFFAEPFLLGNQTALQEKPLGAAV